MSVQSPHGAAKQQLLCWLADVCTQCMVQIQKVQFFFIALTSMRAAWLVWLLSPGATLQPRLMQHSSVHAGNHEQQLDAALRWAELLHAHHDHKVSRTMINGTHTL